MAELEGIDNVLENGSAAGDAGCLLLFRLLVRFRNLRKRDNHERNSKDAHGNHERGSGLDERRILGDFTNEPAEHHRRERRTHRIERAAELHELVALVSAAAKSIEKRVHNQVQHAHRKACNERTRHIDGERADVAGKKLDAHASKANGYSGKRRELVALALEDESAGDTHEEVREEVRKVSKLRKRIGSVELVLCDNAHRTCKVGHECNHEKQRKHGRYREHVSALVVVVAHCSSF